jgi:glycine cleavage system H protein
MTPADRLYTKTHEWLKIEGETALIGITDHAQEALGDITFVERPPVGRKVEKGKAFGSIESVKAASDLFAPVSGEVVQTNAELEKTPGLINEDPYGRGWIIRVKGIEADELASLLDAAAYEEGLTEES